MQNNDKETLTTTNGFYNGSIGTAFKELCRRFQEEIKLIDEFQGTLITDRKGNSFWVSKDGYVLGVDLAKCYDQSHPYRMELERIQKEYYEECALENDIEALKKRIKYAKNPLEKKNYEKQLNAAYKKRKKKGK